MEHNNATGTPEEQAVRPEAAAGKPFLQKYGFPLVVLVLCAVMAAYLLWSRADSGKLPVEAQGAEFSFTDTAGREVTLSGTNGKARLLYFFFGNCPDVCPPTTQLLSQVQDELKEDRVFGDKVQFLSVTIDPDRDTPEALKDFAARFNADPEGWSFLRGDEKYTADIARQYQILVTKDAEGNFGHMNLVVLLDQKGQIRKWIDVSPYIMDGDRPPSDIAKDIKSLL